MKFWVLKIFNGVIDSYKFAWLNFKLSLILENKSNLMQLGLTDETITRTFEIIKMKVLKLEKIVANLTGKYELAEEILSRG